VQWVKQETIGTQKTQESRARDTELQMGFTTDTGPFLNTKGEKSAGAKGQMYTGKKKAMTDPKNKCRVP